MLSKVLRQVGLLAVMALFLNGCVSHPPEPVTDRTQAVRRATYQRLPGSYLGEVRLDLPASNTGLGRSDFYNLFAEYHKGKTVAYGISLASTTQLASEDATMMVNGVGQLPIVSNKSLALPFFRKVHELEVRFDREFVEKSTVTGRYFTLRSDLRTYEFHVPDWMFAALLEALERNLIFLRDDSYNVEEVMTRPTLRERYVNLHPDLPYPIKAAIKAGEVAKDMTTDAVRASWGEPEIILRGRDEKGAFEVWRYPQTKLVIEQGVVTGWEVD